MNKDQDSVFLIVLGAILAFFTTLFVEILKFFLRERKLRANFKIALKLELRHCMSIVEKLIEDYGSKTFFSFSIIDQLDRNLQRLESSRKDTIYLKEDIKREEVLTCINDLLVLASDIRGNENYFFNNPAGESDVAKVARVSYCERQRQMFSLRAVDTKRRIQDLVNYLEIK